MINNSAIREIINFLRNYSQSDSNQILKTNFSYTVDQSYNILQINLKNRSPVSSIPFSQWFLAMGYLALIPTEIST